jgi:hypothetical protein
MHYINKEERTENDLILLHFRVIYRLPKGGNHGDNDNYHRQGCTGAAFEK